MSEKIAVLAPMPSASDRIATPVTIGVARSARKASRRSGMTPIDGSFQVWFGWLVTTFSALHPR